LNRFGLQKLSALFSEKKVRSRWRIVALAVIHAKNEKAVDANQLSLSVSNCQHLASLAAIVKTGECLVYVYMSLVFPNLTAIANQVEIDPIFRVETSPRPQFYVQEP